MPTNRDEKNAPIPLLCSIDEQFEHQGYKISKNTAIADQLAAPELDLSDDIDRNAQMQLLQRQLRKLPPRLKDVLLRRMAGETLDVVGQAIGVTKERVRQLELTAMRKLRDLCGQPPSNATVTHPDGQPVTNNRRAV